MISTDALSIEVIRRRLDASVVGRHVYLFGEVASTNSALSGLARAGAAEGTVVLAEAQRDARARLGRAWFSPAGVNLYASVLFRPALPPHEATLFSFIGSLAVSDAIKHLGVSPSIKWPNDVLVDRRKVAGILAECAILGSSVDFLIIGMGVNLNVTDDALRAALGPGAHAATSLAEILGAEVDRNAFAASYLGHLDVWASRYRADGPAPILAAWRERDIATGRRVEVRGDRDTFVGRVLGVDGSGHLLVQSSMGSPRAILNEEIRMFD